MEENTTDKIADNIVVALNYTVKVDGKVIDSSDGNEPIEFIQGQGQIITGLENQLYGMQVGDHKEILVIAKDGYGEVDPSAFADVPRDEFPPSIPLKPGIELSLKSDDGEELEAHIVSVGEETVRLNFNHPLAGKDLHFTVDVMNLRQATPEEIEHGHVHSEHHHH